MSRLRPDQGIPCKLGAEYQTFVPGVARSQPSGYLPAVSTPIAPPARRRLFEQSLGD